MQLVVMDLHVPVAWETTLAPLAGLLRAEVHGAIAILIRLAVDLFPVTFHICFAAEAIPAFGTGESLCMFVLVASVRVC